MYLASLRIIHYLFSFLLFSVSYSSSYDVSELSFIFLSAVVLHVLGFLVAGLIFAVVQAVKVWMSFLLVLDLIHYSASNQTVSS
jgi:hypothetical protein